MIKANVKQKKYLVTGAAGFIGMYISKRLLELGHNVIGLDNLNNYYQPELKKYRLAKLLNYKNFRFVKEDLANRDGISSLFHKEKFNSVIHLAAQAGVRYSIVKPFAYIDSNIIGMLTILEGCRHNNIEHLIFASSSSVYGMNDKIPFNEEDQVDQPVSLYAATKKSNELMAHSYANLYKIPVTGLRFFTVYGPAGRPDMAPWLFIEAIMNNQPIKIFNKGKMYRDFTYIDDIVESVTRIIDKIPSNKIPYNIFNIGNSEPIELSRFVSAIEIATSKKAKKIMLEMQPGDVERTYADTKRLEAAVDFKPKTEIEDGIKKFVDWYREFHGF